MTASRVLLLAAIVLLSSVIPTPSEAPELSSTARTLRGAPLYDAKRPGRAAQSPPSEGAAMTPGLSLAGGAPPSGEASSFVVAAPALRHGVLSYVDAKYGSDYLALPEPRGTVAEICGPGGCVTRRSTDYGPDQRVHPNRIADLSAADFVRVCGVPLSAGLCRGTVELEPPVNPADDAARVEDGGPAPTLPPTSTEDVP